MFVISLTMSTQYYYPLALAVCAAWGSGVPVFITVIILTFLGKPLEYWSLSVTLDVLATASAISAFGVKIRCSCCADQR